MIKLENFEVVGWEHAIRGMRNPMNSWAKSDSTFSEHFCSNTMGWTDIFNSKLPPCSIPTEVHEDNWTGLLYNIGPNDHDLMMKLAKAGPVHAKYRRMIDVYVDITAPLYWWKEFDTYKVGTVANSCSTMHKIHEKEFTLEDFSCEKLTRISLTPLNHTIDILNTYRKLYVKWNEINDNSKNALFPDFLEEASEYDRKWAWDQMIQLLPSSYNQLRTVKLNYEVLAGIYEYRKDHKLTEWVEFCEWIESLPYSELITCKEAGGAENV